MLEILDLLQGEVEIGGAELAARPQIDGGGDPGQVVDVADHRFDLGFVEDRAGGDLRGDAVDDELGDDALVVLDLLDLGFVDGDLKGALGQILRRRDHAHQDIAVIVVEPGDVVFQLRQVAARQLAIEVGGGHFLQRSRRFDRIAAEIHPGDGRDRRVGVGHGLRGRRAHQRREGARQRRQIDLGRRAVDDPGQPIDRRLGPGPTGSRQRPQERQGCHLGPARSLPHHDRQAIPPSTSPPPGPLVTAALVRTPSRRRVVRFAS